nr:uncharacterized protein LOC126056916 [Helicoverpa armigera]
MSRGFFVTTLLISIAASGFCRPGRPYPKEPTIICGSVTRMENNIIDIANENANINFGSTTIMDGNNPCQGINYVRQVGNTYNGENYLPNENTSLRETHESYTGSDPVIWKSPQISEAYDGENSLPNENTSLWEKSESYTEANPRTWTFPITSEIFGREYFLPKNNVSFWDTSERFSGIDTGIWKYPPETYDGANYLPEQNTTEWEIYNSYTGSGPVTWKVPQSPESYDTENFLPKENTTEWEIYKSYTGSGPVIWNVTQSSETAQNILDTIEKKDYFGEGTLHNLPQYSLGGEPNNMESADEFLNKGTVHNLPQNILDTVQNNLESIENPVDESENTNGIEEEKKIPSEKLGSTNSQTGPVSDKLYIYLFSLIMLFQCKLF